MHEYLWTMTMTMSYLSSTQNALATARAGRAGYRSARSLAVVVGCGWLRRARGCSVLALALALWWLAVAEAVF